MTSNETTVEVPSTVGEDVRILGRLVGYGVKGFNFEGKTVGRNDGGDELGDDVGTAIGRDVGE